MREAEQATARASDQATFDGIRLVVMCSCGSRVVDLRTVQLPSVIHVRIRLGSLLLHCSGALCACSQGQPLHKRAQCSCCDPSLAFWPFPAWSAMDNGPDYSVAYAVSLFDKRKVEICARLRRWYPPA